MTQFRALGGDGGWITNDPEMAKKLRAADNRYERAKMMASWLPLEEKIRAYREAKVARHIEYDECVRTA